MDSSLVYYAVGLLVLVAIIGWRIGGRATSVYGAFEQFQDALEIAPDVVRAVEQLWLSGALPKEARLTEAMKRLGEWFPGLTEQQLRTAVEAGVWLLKHGADVLDIELPAVTTTNGYVN